MTRGRLLWLTSTSEEASPPIGATLWQGALGVGSQRILDELPDRDPAGPSKSSSDLCTPGWTICSESWTGATVTETCTPLWSAVRSHRWPMNLVCGNPNSWPGLVPLV